MKKKIFFMMMLMITLLFNICSAQNQDYGRIKGTITWQDNSNVGVARQFYDAIGTKGDIDAKIYVIPKNFNPASISNEAEQNYYQFGELPFNTNLYYASADVNGNYEIAGISPGAYYVLIISQNTKRDINKPRSEDITYILKQISRNLEQDNLELYTKKYKHTIKTVEIRANVTSNINYDFGNAWK